MTNADPRLNGGRRFGRDRKLSSEKELQAVTAYLSGKPLLEIQGLFEVTKPTLYAVLKRHGVQRLRTKRNAPCADTQRG